MNYATASKKQKIFVKNYLIYEKKQETALPCKTGYPGYPGYPGEFLRNSGDFLKSSLRGAKLFSALTKIKFFVCSMRLGDKDSWRC